MNLVILIGHLGKDPENRNFEGGSVVTFTLATTRQYKRQDEIVKETTWHNISIFGKLGQVALTHLKKGDKISLTGMIANRSYTDKDGIKRYMTSINVTSFEFMSNRRDGNDTPQNEPAQKSSEPITDFPEESNDDLPF